MRLRELFEDGRIVKGVNTTPDVDTNSISKEAGKFGNTVDKDGRPPTLSKKVKGASTNVAFNLGLTETIRKQGDKYVIYSKDGKKKLGTYNSRKAAEKRLGQIEYFKHNENVEENFADGKVKGKSRPGRVKRSGASCNGSVTQLRKRAKKASGEKAKMYHWCANMKSGKKK